MTWVLPSAFSNIDLLYTVMASAERRRDLSAFMMTSHTLYSVGVPLLLRGHVTLSTTLSLESFRNFMFAEKNLKRFAFLRELNIRVHAGEDYLRVHDNINSILRNASFLRHLSMMAFSSIVNHEARSEILRSLSSLHTLESLSFAHSEYLPSLELLESLRSPISELQVWTSHISNDSRTLSALLNIKNTLTKLTFKTHQLARADSGHVLPHVQELTILVDNGLVEDTGTLVSIFPNLRRLSVGGGACLHRSIPTDLRNFNQAQFARLSEKWASLDSISGDLVSLAVLGLRCPVHQITAPRPSDPHTAKYLLGVILGDVGPCILGLRASHDKFEGWALEWFSNLLRGVLTCQKLNGLYLEITINEYFQEHLSTTWVCFLVVFLQRFPPLNMWFFLDIAESPFGVSRQVPSSSSCA